MGRGKDWLKKGYERSSSMEMFCILLCTRKRTHFIACDSSWKLIQKKMGGRLPGVEALRIQCLEKGLTHIFKTWRPRGDIEVIPTTRAPAFSPGSYGTRKLLGRCEFCRFSSFCLSCDITVIVKSTQELYEFKKLPILPVTFPETIWCGVVWRRREGCLSLRN